MEGMFDDCRRRMGVQSYVSGIEQNGEQALIVYICLVSCTAFWTGKVALK
jgi:hypothetical protein